MARWRLELRWAGEVWEFDGELEAELARELQVSAADTEPTELPLELLLPVDVAEMVEAGHALDAVEGDVYLDDELVLRGRAVDPEYGDPERPIGWVSLTLRASALEDAALFPDAAATVDATTWPSADPAAVGRAYPWVFGRPGAGAGPGSPALLVEAALVDGHRYVLVSDDWVAADAVTLIVPSQGSAAVGVVRWDGVFESFTVLRVVDGRGRRVSVIDLEETASTDPAWSAGAEGTEYHVRWDEDAHPGTLGEVLEVLLGASSVPVDAGRVAVARGALTSYVLAGYIDEPTRPIEWITDNLLPIAPVALVNDAAGIYPLLVEVDRLAELAIAHLEAGPDCAPTGPVRWRGDPLNQLTLRYAHRSDADEYLGAVVADPTTDPYADASRRRYAGDAQSGVYAEELSTDVVWAAATAELIAGTILRRRALREREATYQIRPELWGHITRGLVVTITDPARGWARRPALVLSRADNEDGAVLTLVLDEDPFRDRR